MYSKIFVLLFFFFTSSNIFSQIDFIDNLTNWMGDWETQYKPDSETTCIEKLNIDWTYHNRFIKLDFEGKWIEHPASKYFFCQYLTFNMDKEIAGFYMTDAGYDQLAAIRGKVEDDKVILNMVSPSEKWQEIWEYKNGTIHKISKWKDKQSGKQRSLEVEFTHAKK